MSSIIEKGWDLFISHAWRFHDDWNALASMLDRHHPRGWRNFSLPWFDPALNPATDEGGATLRWSLESQIIPVDAVILLSSVFAQQGSRKWIDFEIEMARKHGKPIIGLPSFGQSEVPREVMGVVDAAAPWDVAALFAALSQVSGARN